LTRLFDDRDGMAVPGEPEGQGWSGDTAAVDQVSNDIAA